MPAVEKGIIETALRGFLAGYPVVDFKATVYDGCYHDVDSNELSFKVADARPFARRWRAAKPCLLEPVMKVEIEAPEECAGALMGDLNGRRGKVQGMDSRGRSTVIAAEVPMAEMLSYGTTLTSITQGRGSFHMELKNTMWCRNWCGEDSGHGEEAGGYGGRLGRSHGKPGNRISMAEVSYR